MANKRQTGATGLDIPVTTPNAQSVKQKTPQEIVAWCATLPMADTGAAAKKLFVMLDEISNCELEAKDRYSILELLRAPNKTICTALKRHYVEQRSPLTEHKLTIANLRQALLAFMADNYKLMLEKLHGQPLNTDMDKKLVAVAISRILYYLNVLLICRYQLYTYPPTNIWKEIHLLYKYARERDILDIHVPCQFSPNNHATSVRESYTRIILLFATDPYQWRQAEQHSLNKAIELWNMYPKIYEHKDIPDQKPGIYVIDLDQDLPPTLSNFKKSQITTSCIAMDVAPAVEHLKQLLAKMSDGHLKAKMENPDDPEFSVTIPTITKLIEVWSQTITRYAPRFPMQAQIKIAFGLNTAHYYLNDEQEFNPHPSNLQTAESLSSGVQHASQGSASVLPTFEVAEVDENSASLVENKLEAEEADQSEAEEKAAKDEMYHVYYYQVENISQTGFCLSVKDKSYPPFQAGQIVIFKNTDSENAQWSIGSVRWLRRTRDEEFQMGIQLIAPFSKAAGIQMLRGDKPAGRLIRCLVLPEIAEAKTPPMIITAGLPFHSNEVLLYLKDQEPIKITLTKEIDASGMYYQYVYSTPEGGNVLEQNNEDDEDGDGGNGDSEDKETHTEFDKIWKDL